MTYYPGITHFEFAPASTIRTQAHRSSPCPEQRPRFTNPYEPAQAPLFACAGSIHQPQLLKGATTMKSTLKNERPTAIRLSAMEVATLASALDALLTEAQTNLRQSVTRLMLGDKSSARNLSTSIPLAHYVLALRGRLVKNQKDSSDSVPRRTEKMVRELVSIFDNACQAYGELSVVVQKAAMAFQDADRETLSNTAPDFTGLIKRLNNRETLSLTSDRVVMSVEDLEHVISALQQLEEEFV